MSSMLYKVGRRGIKMNKHRKVSKQFIIGILAYAIAIMIQLIIIKTMELPQLGKVIIALIPMFPAVWGMIGWIKSQRELDELQQKIMIEAGAFSLGMTALITFSYGFLEVFAKFPKITMFSVWVIISLSFIIGQFLANRKYS